jgi:hypothetical protein
MEVSQTGGCLFYEAKRARGHETAIARTRRRGAEDFHLRHHLDVT